MTPLLKYNDDGCCRTRARFISVRRVRAITRSRLYLAARLGNPGWRTVRHFTVGVLLFYRVTIIPRLFSFGRKIGGGFPPAAVGYSELLISRGISTVASRYIIKR